MHLTFRDLFCIYQNVVLVSVEENVETNHHNDEQGPGYLHATGRGLHKFLHIRHLLFGLVQEGYDDHGGSDDGENPERQHHKVGPERSSVEHKEVENARTDGEYGSPSESHVGSTGGASFPEHAEEEDG